MDPYGSSYGLGTGFASPQAAAPSSSSLTKYIWYAIFLLVLGAGTYVYVKRTNKSNDKGPKDGTDDLADEARSRGKQRTSSTSGGKMGTKTDTNTAASTSGTDVDARTEFEKERDWATDAPITKLANFAFESKTKPGFVPNKSGAIAQKPAANPPYKFVACQATASYAIRWNGRYLTVKSPNSVKWTTERQEPGSCFKTVPGYCGAGNGYVMLRSMANKMFVRADASSGLLVCKDTPTARTADAYCWKLNPDPVPAKQPCGQQYSYDLGRIVDVPCEVKEMPTGNDSCSTVTKGYQAACCIRKGPNSHNGNHDAFCEATIFPKVVGQQLQQALLYIRTRRPDLTLKPCPEPCTTQPVPEQYPNTVIIPYDARSGYVTSIPRRLV